MNIMLSTDKPILNSRSDLLDRAQFAFHLATAILKYSSTENFTIGLCGKWGSGKTSVLNMIEENINIHFQNEDADKVPIIVHFDPWYYTDKAQIISQFFKEILASINSSPNYEKLNIVSQAIVNYSSIFDYAGMIPIIGTYLKSLTSLIKGIGTDLGQVAESKMSLEKQKEEVSRALQDLSQKIIVIIDDIDRLNNEQIKLVFQMVNSLADFPNMVYILSFDREIVSRALSEEQNCDGEEYLEKIIQLHFDIPEVQPPLLQKVLFDKLEQLFKEISPNNFDNNYFLTAYEHCIKPFIKSIRDINRIMNVYRFQYNIMHDEVDCIDLLVLVTFQVCIPKIYRWIYSNEYRLTGLYSGKHFTNDEQNKYYNDLNEEIKLLYDDTYTVLESLQVIFPKISQSFGKYLYYDITEDELCQKLRIACPTRFGYYFHLSLNEIPISNDLINQSLYELNAEQLRCFIDKIIENNTFSEYVRIFRANIINLTNERLKLFVRPLIEAQVNRSISESFRSLNSPNYVCEECCWTIFKRLDKAETAKLISELLHDLELNPFSILLGMIKYIEEDYGKFSGIKGDTYKVITDEQLIEIEEVIKNELLNRSKKENLLDSCSFLNIFQMWRIVCEQDCDAYMTQSLTIPSNIPKFYVILAEHWSDSSGNSGWTFLDEYLTKYLNYDDAYKRINELKATEEFSALTTEQKEIVCAYFLWYQKACDPHKKINKKAVDEIVKDWEAKDE